MNLFFSSKIFNVIGCFSCFPMSYLASCLCSPHAHELLNHLLTHFGSVVRNALKFYATITFIISVSFEVFAVVMFQVEVLLGCDAA
jgi:hypothetical protein